MNIKKPAKYKIPKYILKFLDRRAAAAKTFMVTTSKIDAWLERSGIPLTLRRGNTPASRMIRTKIYAINKEVL